jgi:pyruvate/2-oxoglutarate dehydrogenase complex dihydrolipoamide acyltransferase (E2) component
MAQAHGLDLATVQGTGPGGRIVKADVEAALAAPRPAVAPAPAAPTPEEGALLTVAEELPISGVRKVIFKNMHLSLASQAQLTLHTEASALRLREIRQALNAKLAPGQAKVGYNAVILKAVARALRLHPRINASVEGDRIVVWREVHIGLAVDLGQGLIVPKVRNADHKSIVQIAQDLDDLLVKAKAGQLSPDDLAAGTFTVTNLGAWDVDNFTPIVNNPESAILGLGRIVDKPWVRDGQVVAEPRLALSLTFDHRIIDGAPGAAFLKTIKDMLEEPLLML